MASCQLCWKTTSVLSTQKLPSCPSYRGERITNDFSFFSVKHLFRSGGSEDQKQAWNKSSLVVHLSGDRPKLKSAIRNDKPFSFHNTWMPLKYDCPSNKCVKFISLKNCRIIRRMKPPFTSTFHRTHASSYKSVSKPPERSTGGSPSPLLIHVLSLLFKVCYWYADCHFICGSPVLPCHPGS